MTTRKAATKTAQASEPTGGMDRLDKMSLGQLQAKFAEVVGERTRSPNKVYLQRRIHEAIVSAAPPATNPEGPDESSSATDGSALRDRAASAAPADFAGSAAVDAEGSTPAGPASQAEAATPANTPKLSKLDVPALKIQEAQKGHVPLGPRPGRRQAGDKAMVLPLRMEASVVGRLDEARALLGLRSRMDLLRRSLASYLASVGEIDVAALLTGEP